MAPLELSPAEQTALRELGERALRGRDLWQGKIYLTRVETASQPFF